MEKSYEERKAELERDQEILKELQQKDNEEMMKSMAKTGVIAVAAIFLVIVIVVISAGGI